MTSVLYGIGLLIGILAGFAAGGRLRSLAYSVRLRFVWLLYVALGIQLFGGFATVDWLTTSRRFVLLLVSYGLLAAWLAISGVVHRGWLRAGFLVIGVGTFVNLIAIAPNRGIPVSRHALDRAGAPLPSTIPNRFALKHVIAGPDTTLNMLGDVIPIPALHDVVSAGDLVVMAGIALVLAAGMTVAIPLAPAPALEAAEPGAGRARPVPGMLDGTTTVEKLLARFASQTEPRESAGNMSDVVRRPSESRVVLSQAMGITDANLSGNVHGGVIMKLVDTAAGLAAIKHGHGRVVTVSMDEMSFLEPVFLTDVVTLQAQVNDVGRTSMEVGVRVEAENTVTGGRRHVSSAYLVFVALDEEGRPRPVPRLEPETDEERRRMEDAKIRRRHRIARKDALMARRAGEGPAVPPPASFPVPSTDVAPDEPVPSQPPPSATISPPPGF